jgi:predicted cobalt transporter CbtA
MDVLDMELIRKGLKSMKREAPEGDSLQRLAVGGELVCDTAYYGLVGMGGKKGAWFRGALLGLLAGVTAVVLPKPLGLPEESSNKTAATQLMTIGLYVMGGLAAAAVTEMVDSAPTRGKMAAG